MIIRKARGLLTKPNIIQLAPFQGTPSVERGEMVSHPIPLGVITDTFISHDTAGKTQQGLIRNTIRKHREQGSTTGVTFSIGLDHPDRPEAILMQHHSLDGRYSKHCCPQNVRMTGVEVVNFFDPRKHKPHSKNQEIIAASWFSGKRVISPTLRQLEQHYRLVRWLISIGKCKNQYPGILGGEMVWQTLPAYRLQGAAFVPGVYAHGHLNAHRADGYLQVVYTWLRANGYSQRSAYAHMKKMSATAKRSPKTGYIQSKFPPSKRTRNALIGGALVAAAAATLIG